MTSLSDLRFELLKNTVDWDDQYKQLEQIFQNKSVDVISHTHTARNIGQINIQIVWYIPSSDANAYTCKHLSNRGDLNTLLNEAKTYLNTYVAPHHLVSISVFEDDHPCPDKLFHAVVLHKGSDHNPLQPSSDIHGSLYDLESFTSQEGWEEVLG